MVFDPPFAPTMPNEIPLSEIIANSDKFTKWNFTPDPNTDFSTGYEDYASELKKFNSQDFHNASPEEQKAIISYVCDIYEKVGIFPIPYYSDKGIHNEIIKCMNATPQFNGNTISAAGNAGTSLCSFMMPNLYKTPSIQDMTPDKAGGETAWDKFYNRKFLEKAISFCYNYNQKPGSKDIGFPGTNPMSGLRMIGSVPTNFRPMNAKAIYERFAPAGGTVYDASMGFGGRMLGCLSSSNNYRYVGTDPNTETVYNLNRLGQYIENTTGRKNSYELHCVGSEEFCGEPNSVDFMFTSPPYYDLEQYGSDGGDFNSENQSYNKYPTLESWMDGYVRGTIENIQKMLKKRRYYAINIASFTRGSEHVRYVDDWCRISEEYGMPVFDTVYLGVRARSGAKELGDASGSHKDETITIFKKR